MHKAFDWLFQLWIGKPEVEHRLALIDAVLIDVCLLHDQRFLDL
jgi:hypothetical protein